MIHKHHIIPRPGMHTGLMNLSLEERQRRAYQVSGARQQHTQKCWVKRNLESKFIFRNELDKYFVDGWVLGRVTKTLGRPANGTSKVALWRHSKKLQQQEWYNFAL
jgi:hypothetical protein